MDNAQTLFRQGIAALRDQQDAVLARRLFTQSLKLDPNNEMAWLWLSRTIDDPQRQRQCIERALRLNPKNEMALALQVKLNGASQPPAEPEAPEQPRAKIAPLAAAEQRQIAALLAQADHFAQAEDYEHAIEQWVHVLDIQVDHPVAIQSAVRQLFKLGYQDDANELITHAIDAGTTSIPIYMTGIDLAHHLGHGGQADELREQVAGLPTADDDLILKMVDYFADGGQPNRAAAILDKALALHPDDQALLLRMGDLQEKTLGRAQEAAFFYDRAAHAPANGKSKTRGDRRLRDYTPVITDRERGSLWLAVREALGFGAAYLFLGWQDAGLNLLHMGATRWLGVLLSIVGGYLLVTAFSSPQQQPLASWLGGRVPDNPLPKPRPIELDRQSPGGGAISEPTAIPILPAELRGLFALVGLIVLAGAFVLVFSMSIYLLQHPVPPYIYQLKRASGG